MKETLTLYRTKAIRKKLIDWFAASMRPLPWRKRKTPYRVWISEIMAQQTRIETVVPYFNRFVKRFPDAGALAAAHIDQVLELWAGLGYYSRARNLHKAAKMIVDHYGGDLPGDPTLLRKLPGIGDYTAGAIASMAFGVSAPIVDGNVIRVFSRLFDMEEDTARQSTWKKFWAIAADLVPKDNPGPFNEGLMELGATVCTPLSPRCDLCPLSRHCAALKAGTVAERPVRTRAKPPKEVSIFSIILRRADGAFLLVQNPYQGLFGGLWILPSFPPDFSESAKGGKKAFAQWLADTLASPVTNLKKTRTFDHVLSHRKLKVTVYECAVDLVPEKMKNKSWKNSKWIRSKKDLAGLGLARITEKALGKS